MTKKVRSNCNPPLALRLTPYPLSEGIMNENEK